VPEPDISSLSDSTSEGIELPGWQKFSSGIMQLEAHSNARQES
jgi:hypothetical protein